MTSDTKALKAAWRRSCTIKEKKIVHVRSAAGGTREQEISLSRVRRAGSPSLRAWARDLAANRRDAICSNARDWLAHKGIA